MSNRYLSASRVTPTPDAETRVPTRPPVRNLRPPSDRAGSEAARLVREHRAVAATESSFPRARALAPRPAATRSVPTVFDFEEH